MSTGDTSSEEVRITVPIVRGLIAAQFPRWADLDITAAPTQGVDNATYRLGPEMSVRLPRYSRWIGQVTREQRWLPELTRHLPLPIPRPLAQGEPSGDYPFPFSILRWLPGERVVAERLDPDHTVGVLADFLTALQEIDPTGGPQPEWSNGFRGCAIADERDTPVRRGWVETRLAPLAGQLDIDALTEVYESAFTAPGPATRPVWIHGDPVPGNLLAVDDQLAAFIDFGTMAVGDPACDLIAAWTLLPPRAREAFRDKMGIDDATWARGRAWGLTAVLPSIDELADQARAFAARRRVDELIADSRG